ncbi:hypothetical protein R6U77_00775 [Lysinibacillus louembei]|uniref:Uncharacterized protein n=1 Tax=Lysinibacillus louembei TaxID=1470088 RepID=A0ABZ0RVI4_9BACI|nr:hypothetical protein [Lysinibacillus louembei]WPK12252.1 hypothetical protein R6U77_00775 [Lysinibacillus louembei]
MKIKIICENCNSETELIPETVGKLSYVQRKLRDGNFRMFENEISHDVSSSLYDDFIEKLVVADNKKQVEDLLNREIEDNVNIDSKLESLRIDCRGCGNYIVLTEFD